MTVTAEFIRRIVIYDPETGSMIWRDAPKRLRRLNGRELGAPTRRGYRIADLLGKTWGVHRLVWLYVYGRWPEGDIDHINGDKSDNRICNLREATRSQNIANSKPQQGRLKGAHFHVRKGLWQSGIRYGGKTYCLGFYQTPEEAHAAYARRAIEVHGEFARLR